MSRSNPVNEIAFWIEANGRRLASWTCSPDALDALAIGWLLAEGYLEAGDEVPAVEIVEGAPAATEGIEATSRGARLRLPEPWLRRGDEARRRRRDVGTGPLSIATAATASPGHEQPGTGSAAPAAPDPAPPPSGEAAELFRQLYAEAERYRGGGGHHSAALFEGRELRAHAEEVGRHNAVDKVIGQVILSGADPVGMGLVLSARVSAEIAIKAARARLGWIASRSVPTTLALSVAAAAQIPILARAAGREPRLYRPEEFESGPATSAATSSKESAS